ncbi:Hint domain-containing protein [Sinisalibacter lacisalsi]|uniref:PA14 domain-containing protein n=1 Tax=Sinisalibacter lacisalsi TaxID=1526570 RepID=A0ABQ1QQJ0_9RHOB|nr:Hint domain-containing protein [Sinisalibacter lacisalsi]GGD41129.1 hypothetical protein GCM10011358_26230 [Sinisalibacter lacisalsi]
MATMNSGLGGPAGYGEGVFSSSPKIGNNDDGSVNVDITSVFGGGGIDFFGNSYTSLYVNSNGNITFGSANTAYQTANLSSVNTPTIAPFFSDVNINSGGEIYWDLDPVAGTVTVTWDSVRPYFGSGENSFQVVITSTGSGDFELEFIYEQIEWTTGYSQVAETGFTDGGANDYELPGSGDAASLADYENTDFATGDPDGVSSFTFANGEPFYSDGIVEGTAGDDLLDASYAGDPDGDTIGAGDDNIFGYGGNDTIFAGAGNDTVTGGAGDDVISGGSGDDVIYGDGPSDPGLWAYEVWNHDFTSASGQAFDAESGTLAGTGTTQGFDSTQLVNDARGSGGDPSDFGVVYTSTLQPTQTGVYTFATTSDDGSTIRILDADGTPLTWTNQDGSTASYMNNDYHQAATTRSGEVTLEEGVSYTIEVRHWENAGQQVISGTVTSPGGLTEDLADSAMILGPDAAAGNDVIDGGAGDDVIWGGAGDDQITGGTGADQLFGEAGDDTITLGAGDTASGGAGDDLFSLDPATALGGPGATIVIDGDEDGETDGDTLDFSGLIDWGSITYTDPETGSASLADGTTVSFSNIENIIICFTRGTLIETPFGPRPIEDLRPGDFVLTRDHGPQPLRWVGASEVAGEDSLAPIRFARGAFGNDRPLLVSPQHRMLYAGSDAVLYFDTSEVMVPAKHLVNGTSITVVEMARVRYYHMLFDRHEVVWANGAPCESFHPGMEGLAAIDGPAREELFRLFPELRSNPGGYGKTARTVLRGYEARLIEVA